MLSWLKQEYVYLHGTFHDSEVILWSRLQVLLATVWVSLQGVDVTPVVSNPKYLVYWIIFSNVVNELLRRNREDWHK